MIKDACLIKDLQVKEEMREAVAQPSVAKEGWQKIERNGIRFYTKLAVQIQSDIVAEGIFHLALFYSLVGISVVELPTVVI